MLIYMLGYLFVCCYDFAFSKDKNPNLIFKSKSQTLWPLEEHSI